MLSAAAPCSSTNSRAARSIRSRESGRWRGAMLGPPFQLDQRPEPADGYRVSSRCPSNRATPKATGQASDPRLHNARTVLPPVLGAAWPASACRLSDVPTEPRCPSAAERSPLRTALLREAPCPCPHRGRETLAAPRRRLREGDQRADDPLRTRDGVLHLGHQPHRLDLRIIGEFLREVDGADGNAGLGEALDDLGGGLRGERLADVRDARLRVRDVLGVEGVEVRIVARIVGDAEQLPDPRARPRGDRAELHYAVLRCVGHVEAAPGRGVRADRGARGDHLLVASPTLPDPADILEHRVANDGIAHRLAHHLVGLERDRGSQQRRLHLLALAGHRAVVEGREHAGGSGQGARQVAQRRAIHGRRLPPRVELPLTGNQPRERGRHGVDRPVAREGPVGAPTGELAVDDVGAQLPELLVVDAQPPRQPVAVVHGDDVEGGNQAMHEGSPGLLLEIDHDASLVAVERLKPFRLAGHHRTPEAMRISLRTFHLHDVGAEVGEDAAEERRGDDLRELQDPYAVEWAVRHGNPPRVAGHIRRR